MGEPRPRGPLRPQPPWVPAVPGRVPQPIVPLMPRISLLRVHLNSAEPVLQSRGNIPRAKEPENCWGKSTSAQGTPVQAARAVGREQSGVPGRALVLGELWGTLGERWSRSRPRVGGCAGSTARLQRSTGTFWPGGQTRGWPGTGGQCRELCRAVPVLPCLPPAATLAEPGLR